MLKQELTTHDWECFFLSYLFICGDLGEGLLLF